MTSRTAAAGRGRWLVESDRRNDVIVARKEIPTSYHLSVVVDDVDMAITHVVRGDDHISNTPKQILLYRALGAEVDLWAIEPGRENAVGVALGKAHAVAGRRFDRGDGVDDADAPRRRNFASA